ncbi:helix-turn-helix domain-containing protein [Asaia sp. As-1742]|uniref:helix-turn-helix domain-containing protein n=1 Tax=Asaia sp. As-1742 TaxID=2608325 RepID=UPI00141DA2E0|nr:helix-turn-helix transcriptional regulator [Asaia sp. As-1742]NIE80030.1 helix-turn-helix transcriptional regulator [Asaia sp. As-1742]
MTDPTPFNRLLGERVRRMIVSRGRTQESVAIEAGISTSTLSFLIRGQNSTINTVLSVLAALKAPPEVMAAIYADFVEHWKERADG